MFMRLLAIALEVLAMVHNTGTVTARQPRKSVTLHRIQTNVYVDNLVLHIFANLTLMLTRVNKFLIIAS